MKRGSFYAKTTTDVEEMRQTADAILESGTDTVTNLTSQNEMLRGSHSRLHQLGTALGLTQTTMRRIGSTVRANRQLVVVAVVILILAALGLLVPLRSWLW